MAKKQESDPLIGGELLSAWQERWRKGDELARKYVVYDLTQLGKSSAKAFPLMIEIMRTGDEDLRDKTRSLLSNLGPKLAKAVPELTELLSDSDPMLRNLGAVVLWRVGPAAAAAVPQLSMALQDADRDVRWFAYLALTELGPLARDAKSAVVECIERRVDQDFQYLKLLVAIGFGDFALPYYLRDLRDPSWEIRASAAAGMSGLGSAARVAEKELMAALTDEHPRVRNATAMTLFQIGGDAAIAANTLADTLHAVSTDPNLFPYTIDHVRLMGPAAAPAVPRLIELLSSDDWHIQLGGLRALREMGSAAADALPVIKNLMQHSQREVRECANEVHGRIACNAPSGLAGKADPQNDIADFITARITIEEQMRQGIEEFLRLHPEEEICCVGLHGQGFMGIVTLCLETPSHNAAAIDDPVLGSAIAEDKHGKYLTAIYDFKYTAYREIILPNWPNFHNLDGRFRIRTLEGKLRRGNLDRDGDDAINKPVFDLLVKILKAAPPFPGLKRAKPFRLGVEEHDSGKAKFWVPTALE